MAEKKKPLLLEDSYASIEHRPNRNTKDTQPMLVIRRGAGDLYPFVIGFARAKVIMKHMEDIKKFLDRFSAQYGDKP